ncbi:MAG: GntR family transcriptional regulator [Rhodoferax sp.]|nr:MAG: GntR family transcriptional regulator [Rhodoferax sp.]
MTAAPSSTTLQDDTYTTLRQWVTVGKFLPGERLKIRNVAQALGVGVMPVRAALLRLAAEGALTHSANKGVSVPSLSKAEFDDVLQNRLLLEGEAAERGTLRMDAAQRQRLRALVQTMDAALQTNDAKAYLDANEDFHVHLYKAAGSPLLMTLIETVWLKVGPLSNQLFDNNPNAGVLNDAHTDMLKALDQGDASGVRRAIERDLFVAGQFLRSRCNG